MLSCRIKNIFSNRYHGYHNSYINKYGIITLASKKKIWKKVILTAEQQEEIQSVFGHRIKYKWHRLYQFYSGVFKKDYFPEVLFSTRLEPILCPSNIGKVLQDKSLTEILYSSVPNLKFPKSVIINSSDIYYDGNRNIVNKDMAISYVEHWCRSADFIIKPTSDRKAGENIVKCKKEFFYNRDKIEDLFNIYKRNFMIQECIVNHESISTLYDKSLNTFQIMTYILDDKLHHTPLILKIGRYGSETDDELYIGISDDGYLRKEAFSKEGERCKAHPDSNVIFEGYYIPYVEKLIECAYSCHKKTPHIKFISWDFTLDKNASPILIGADMLGHSTWLPQVVCGESLFGNNTERILELIGY